MLEPLARSARSPRASDQRSSFTLSTLPVLLLGCGFESYSEKPLEGEAVVAQLAAERRTPLVDPSVPLTLARAAELLRARGPAIREATAAYLTAKAQADATEPLPNPSITAGPLFGFGPGVQTNPVVPLGSLNLRIPWSGRLSRQDERDLAVAGAARADALASFREQYLELRARFLELAVARAQIEVRERMVSGAEETLGIADVVVQAGGASALDVSLFTLELARERARLLSARLDAVNAETAMAEFLAVDAEQLGPLPADALPARPDRVPDPELLRQTLAVEHPQLFRLRAAYEIAERQLRLEIAEQYPDLVFGVNGSGDPGEERSFLGLTLGIQLPIFDRNQPGVAEARQRREEVRVRYEAAAHRALSSLEQAYRALALATAQHDVLRDEVLPAAKANVEIAVQSLAVGSAGGLQLLDAERSLRQVEIELLEAALAEQLAWSALERAVGYPLVRFGSDPGSLGKTPPPGLTEQGETR